MDLGLRGKTALVCASTAGLGRATAEALAHEGVRVVITGRRKDVAEKIVADLPGSEAVEFDITENGAAGALVAQARKALGAEIDIVVLNGPGPTPGDAADTSAEALREAFETLTVFQQQLVAELLPGMRERGWGRIIAVGSSSVFEPMEGVALSNIGRAALAAYLKTLATEVARDGVTVNMLVPGRIDTERVRSLDEGSAGRLGLSPDEVAERMAATIPVGRYGHPAEFGAAAAFLCSMQASYITGSAVRVDGGALHHL